jgi:hypothetical protein
MGNSPIFWLLVFGVSAFACDTRADSVTYEIRVVDEKSRPISGATVWVLGDAFYRTDLRPADLARLVRRYSADVDFIFTSDLHGHLWVLRTAPDGSVQHERPDKDVHGLARVRTSFAGLKRGYHAAQVDDDAPIDSRRQILLRLQRDPAAVVDARMDEFDRIRAAANPGNDVEDPMASRRVLKAQDDKRLRDLAAALENDGRPDDAAAIYHNLAYLPSAKTAVIGRNINESAGDGEQRMADFLRFRKLQRGHPQFEYEDMMNSYLGKGMDFMMTKGAPLRRAYIAKTEEMIGKYGERLWPYAYARLSWAYVENREFEAGCRALRAFHDFDPSVSSPENWTRDVERFQDRVRENGGPMKFTCEITGVPPPKS